MGNHSDAMQALWSFLFVVILTTVTAESLPCAPRDFDHGSVVCVCNATYCDTFGPVEVPEDGEFYQVVSSRDGERFNATSGSLVDELTAEPDVLLKVNRSEQYQKIIGFGGAFTDAATINLAALSEPLQKSLLEAYYGKDGIEYNIGRVNMGGCDFSTRLYTYDDVEGDEELTHFELAEEDTEYKIPYVLRALEINPSLKMFASPWTAPKWMKTNNDYVGYGFLKEEYYQAWANYFVRFLDEYAKRNVSFWAVTAQNEPIDGTIPGFAFNCMGWTPAMQRDFIKKNLGPTIAGSAYNNTKIIMFDDQRPFILIWGKTVLGDPEADKYVSGIGVHWYIDAYPASILTTAHEEFPDKFILGTEACAGSLPLEDPVILGSWMRAQLYAEDIIGDLNHWVSGWTDWNLYLDLEGGPNWEGNTVDAPIIVDNVTDVAYKQPMYYALGHFSKFLPEGSVRVSAEAEDRKGLLVTAFQRPDEAIAVIVLNMGEDSVSLAIDDTEKGIVEVVIGPKSIHSIVY